MTERMIERMEKGWRLGGLYLYRLAGGYPTALIPTYPTCDCAATYTYLSYLDCSLNPPLPEYIYAA